jgi:DnaK suppressor protein
MTPKDLATYRRSLETKRAELLSVKHDPAEIMIQRAPDSIDELVLKSERELAVDNLNRRSELLAQIAAALDRIRTGSYGVCLGCDAPIAERRLNAVPWAVFCLECQESADQNAAAPILQER